MQDDTDNNSTMSLESQAAQIVDFMRNAWKLPVPELIISVTGGANAFKIPLPRIHQAFQQGLVKAAMTTSAWIFTSGTHVGVTKEIGNAFDKCRYRDSKVASTIPLIGIVNWYTTTDNKQLTQDSNDISQDPNSSSISDLVTIFNRPIKNRVCLYRLRKPLEKEKPETYPLDHNHTHFLMLQDEFGDDDIKWKNESGATYRANLILNLRAKIEEESRKITNQGQTYLIPMVQILVEGGVTAILTVCESVVRQTPVIVMANNRYILRLDTYGFIDGLFKDDSYLDGMLIFTRNDVIRNSGNITELSIHFSQLPLYNIDNNDTPEIFLYIILTTEKPDEFIIINRYQLSNKEIESRRSTGNIQTFMINEPVLYLETGNYLGVGFGSKAGRPFRVKGSDSYYIDLKTANATFGTYKPVFFIKQAIYGVTFSFKMSPVPSFIRELFLWSIAASHSNLATCLCSHSIVS
ncbi:unnamed protein product [Rotaria sp. Silwood1]|nr:unnamed protein product [Rotaria sp. Silwood1]